MEQTKIYIPEVVLDEGHFRTLVVLCVIWIESEVG